MVIRFLSDLEAQFVVIWKKVMPIRMGRLPKVSYLVDLGLQPDLAGFSGLKQIL